MARTGHVFGSAHLQKKAWASVGQRAGLEKKESSPTTLSKQEEVCLVERKEWQGETKQRKRRCWSRYQNNYLNCYLAMARLYHDCANQMLPTITVIGPITVWDHFTLAQSERAFN